LSLSFVISNIFLSLPYQPFRIASSDLILNLTSESDIRYLVPLPDPVSLECRLPRLQSGLDVDWVSSESCIITWKDNLNLEPKILGSETQPVTLWFGTKQKDHLWVILLQRTITLKISDRSVAFDFFTSVDPHSILFEKSPIHSK
jgi:hypothetical protein